MKKGIHVLLSVGLLLGMTARPNFELQFKQYKKAGSALVAFLILERFYYTQLAASPYEKPELPKDATQLEKVFHFLYYKVAAHSSKKVFKRMPAAHRSFGEYRESTIPAKGLGKIDAFIKRLEDFVKAPALIFGLVRLVDILLAKQA